MRDTTLNAIAITVFAITLASLLGPLVHLSPAVVAGVAVTGLGVFTLDQLNLQGRLGNLLSDSLAWLSADHRQRVLYHEAGHFLVAVLLDIPVEAYSLTTWDAWKQGLPGQGGVIFGPGDQETALWPQSLTPQGLDRYYQVWMAGIAAERLIYGHDLGGADDIHALERLWQRLGRSQAEGLIKQRWALLQAKTLLDRHREAFDALVVAMGDRAPVEGCLQMIHPYLSKDEPSPAKAA